MIPILRIAACLLGRFGAFDIEYIGRGRLFVGLFMLHMNLRVRLSALTRNDGCMSVRKGLGPMSN